MTDDPRRAATLIQTAAADPTRSVVLRAAAGSGKTRVLVDRFIRLCVQDAPSVAHPRSILAITFTRKAAVEIQERLLARAAHLALADPEVLRDELRDLFADRSDPDPSDGELHRAAGLYDLMLEDMSALNVGTIHAFCQTILGRFAAEAGLDPGFTVLENQEDLQDEAMELLLTEVADSPKLTESAALLGKNPAAVKGALYGIFNNQLRLERWFDGAAARGGGEASGATADGAEVADIAAALTVRHRQGLLPRLIQDLREFLFPELAGRLVARDDPLRPNLADFMSLLRKALPCFRDEGCAGILAEVGDNDRLVQTIETLKKKVDEVLPSLVIPPAALAGHEQKAQEIIDQVATIFVTSSNKVRVFTRIQDADLKARFQVLVTEAAGPILDLLHKIACVDLFRTNVALLRLGLRLLDIYDDLKRRDRVVDFQDLEDMARRLMGDPARAVSLLYRLDDSLQHILVDEFQDTNFNQWDILEPFAAEFLAGGDDAGGRTVFFVGDVKQSIYGFRGAEPLIFRQVRRLLESRDLPSLKLPTNFRSLAAIVDGAACLFAQSPWRQAMGDHESAEVGQACARRNQPGVFHLLAPFAAASAGANPADAPDGPTTAADQRSGDQLAATAAAQLVRNLVDGGATTWEGFGDDARERPLAWRDILVLYRSRTEVGLYEQAFRDAGIPLVPAGRGMLAASREVQDILALLRWLTYPDDDVALATVLRSPLLRLSEEDFQGLLARRGLDRRDDSGRRLPPHGLWRTLRPLREDRVYGRAATLLAGWRRHADRETCHALLRRIFRQGRVLERYERSLGGQARYNLLRLFDIALGGDVSGTPTVRTLAEAIATAGRRGGLDEGALPEDADQGRVRFMTVHGAKGLEAPVVVLVDGDRIPMQPDRVLPADPGSSRSPLLLRLQAVHRRGFTLPEGVTLVETPVQLTAAAAEQRARTEEANLVYVALTRARDRLYVLGGERPRGRADGPLTGLRAAAEAGACASVSLDDPPEVSRPPQSVSTGVEAATVPSTAADGVSGATQRHWSPPKLSERFTVLTPSAADEAAPRTSDRDTVPSDLRDDANVSGPDSGDRFAALERGEQIHRLLELAVELGRVPAGPAALRREAEGVFTDPSLGWIFRPEEVGGRGACEVPFAARHDGDAADHPTHVTGIIDRLVVRPGRIDIIDYKTNRIGDAGRRRDDLVLHYRSQLELYREAMAGLYPGAELHTWLLFTDPDLAADQRLVEVT